MVSLNALWPFELEGLKSNWQVFNFHLLLLHTPALFLFSAVAKGGGVLIGSNVYLSLFRFQSIWKGTKSSKQNNNFLCFQSIWFWTVLHQSLQLDESVWTDRGWFIEPTEAFLQLYNRALGIVKAVPNRILKLFCTPRRLIHIALQYWSIELFFAQYLTHLPQTAFDKLLLG